MTPLTQARSSPSPWRRPRPNQSLAWMRWMRTPCDLRCPGWSRRPPGCAPPAGGPPPAGKTGVEGGVGWGACEVCEQGEGGGQSTCFCACEERVHAQGVVCLIVLGLVGGGDSGERGCFRRANSWREAAPSRRCGPPMKYMTPHRTHKAPPSLQDDTVEPPSAHQSTPPTHLPIPHQSNPTRTPLHPHPHTCPHAQSTSCSTPPFTRGKTDPWPALGSVGWRGGGGVSAA